MRNENELRAILNNLPISINAQLGDPFQKSQWSDTKKKLTRLETVGYEGPVALITKSILTQEQLFFIEQSRLDLFVFLSITGLNENQRVSFDEIRENYFKVCDTKKPVAIFIRPIIPGRNDNITTIKPIIEMATSGNRVVIIRGYKDIFKLSENAFINVDFLSILKEFCSKREVAVYDKTALYVAALRKNHFFNYGDDQMYIGAELLQRIGYPVKIEDETIILDHNYKCSQGDLNFIRMVSGQVVTRELNGKDAIMTIKRNGIMLDCSSSWFGWARRVPCEINCWYCISKVEGLNGHKEAELGCLPTEML